jgi:hypothetical protein
LYLDIMVSSSLSRCCGLVVVAIVTVVVISVAISVAFVVVSIVVVSIVVVSCLRRGGAAMGREGGGAATAMAAQQR